MKSQIEPQKMRELTKEELGFVSGGIQKGGVQGIFVGSGGVKGVSIRTGGVPGIFVRNGGVAGIKHGGVNS